MKQPDRRRVLRSRPHGDPNAERHVQVVLSAQDYKALYMLAMDMNASIADTIRTLILDARQPKP